MSEPTLILTAETPSIDTTGLPATCSARAASPATGALGRRARSLVELANITRGDFDFVPGELDAGGFKLDVEPSERIRLRDVQRDEGRAEKARAKFVRKQKKRSNVTQAVKKTAAKTSYSERQYGP